MLRGASSKLRAERHSILSTAFAGALSEGLAMTGRHDDALATMNEAIDEAGRRGEPFDMPELLRVKALVLTLSSSPDEQGAEACLSRAVVCARRQGALAWELRAVTTLAQLWPGPCARTALATTYARFTEGLQTVDLKAAKDLLDRLSRASGPARSHITNAPKRTRKVARRDGEKKS